MLKHFAISLLVAIQFGGPSIDADEVAQEKPIVELQTGDRLPDFSLVDDQGRNWKSVEHTAGKVTVIYFYPGDFTRGCTAQAQKFDESLKELADLGVEVIGISGDQAATHKLFKEAYGLDHTLLADTEGIAAQQLGVPVGRPGKARLIGTDRQPVLGPDGKSVFVARTVTLERWTFVVDQQGKVISKRKAVNPVTDAEEVIQIVKKLR